MKEIKMTNCDAMALVSDEDYEYIAQFNWHRADTGYAASTMGHDPRRKGEKHPGPKTMHRIIVARLLGTAIPEGHQIDHADRNKLNNTRENLRLCQKAQNMANIPAEAYLGSSKYKGVAKRKRKWVAQISIDNRTKYLGLFNTEEAAAAAYNRAAKERFGEFAYLNPIPDDVEDTPNPIRFNNKKGKNPYRGITYHKQTQKWAAQLRRDSQHHHLGLYSTPEEAARAYDRKAYELYGDAAPLNFPDEIEGRSQ